jgi:hypothetical protein
MHLKKKLQAWSVSFFGENDRDNLMMRIVFELLSKLEYDEFDRIMKRGYINEFGVEAHGSTDN